MKAGMPLLLAIGLGACAPDPLAMTLAEIDFTDMEEVQEIRQDLRAEDRPVFSTFIVKHVATSSSFCGETLVTEDGKLPQTLGEALALTVLREEREGRERLAAERPLPATELARRDMETLSMRRELLAAKMGELRARFGSEAEQKPEWTAVTDQIADLDRQIGVALSATKASAQ